MAGPYGNGGALETSGRERESGLDGFDAEKTNGLDETCVGDAEHQPQGGLLPQHQRPGEATRTRSTAYLDGLRGLAASLVYLFHQVTWFYGVEDEVHHGFGYHGEYSLTTMPFVRSLFTGGIAAVSIFFVLSGYVLSKAPLSILLRDGGGGQGMGSVREIHSRLVSAFIRRPFRLFIPVIGVSLAFALAMHLPFGLMPQLSWPTPQETILEELVNWVIELWLVLNPFAEHGSGTAWFPYDPPAWTMAIEWRGSMLVYGLVAIMPLFGKRHHRAVFLVLLCVLFLFVYQWAMACFVAGMILAMNDLGGPVDGDVTACWRFSLTDTARSAAYHLLLIVGWWICGQPIVSGHIEYSSETPGWKWLTELQPRAYREDDYWRFWNAIGAIMVVTATLRLPWLQQLLTTRPMRYLGKISFSLYLIHIPLLWVVGDRIIRFAGTVREESGLDTWFNNRLVVPDVGPHGLSTRFIVCQLIILPMNLYIAHLGTKLLDEPSIRVGKWVGSKWQKLAS